MPIYSLRITSNQCWNLAVTKIALRVFFLIHFVCSKRINIPLCCEYKTKTICIACFTRPMTSRLFSTHTHTHTVIMLNVSGPLERKSGNYARQMRKLDRFHQIIHNFWPFLQFCVKECCFFACLWWVFWMRWSALPYRKSEQIFTWESLTHRMKCQMRNCITRPKQ